MSYELNPDVISKQLENDESVLLNLKTRKFFTINETASVIWSCLKEGKEDAEILQALVDGFEIGATEARTHVDEFIQKLEREGILTRV